jgi:predicted NAD/FAD-binding protein
MTKVRYIGPHPEGVEVVMPDGRPDAYVPHGEMLDTSVDHAAALLEQPSNWEKATPPRKRRRKGGE